MKKLVMTALLAMLGSAGAAAAQAPTLATAPNAVYVELLGNGGAYSVNYDRLLTLKVAARVGVMGLGIATDSGSAGVLAAPVMVSYLFGEGSHHFETGIGLMLAAGAIEEVEGLEDESFSGAVGTATIGYRYQRPGGQQSGVREVLQRAPSGFPLLTDRVTARPGAHRRARRRSP
jgi:hypothetical protein